MSAIGLRIGPYEIVEPVWIPEPGRWFRARGGETDDVLIRLPQSPTTPDERVLVRHQFEVLRHINDLNRGADAKTNPGKPTLLPIPAPLLFDEASSALAVQASAGAPLTDAVLLRRDETVVMTPSTLLDLVLEIARGLRCAHQAGHTHGHLDPDNVILDPEGRVFLYGLGVAGLPQEQWMPPEIARRDEPTALTDQWSLGAIAIGLVLGHGVWQEDVVLQSTNDLARSVRAVAEQWPSLGRVLGKMLDPVPRGRFPTMGDAHKELAALARLAGVRSDREEIGQLLCTRRKLRPPPRLFAGPSTPTAVPSTDAASDPSEGAWFARRSDPGLPEASFDLGVGADLGRGSDPSGPIIPVSEAGRAALASRSSPDPLARPSPPHGPTILPADELSLGSERPNLVRTRADGIIVKLAPVLAVVMVLLLVVWVFVNVIL